ncbi:SRPBCC family protein [Streptomyces sp. NPDC002018]|uniref:SRPBCC family protein n=1 Tax=Streptomyces sp. NPDC002018 TaxID=3364629 RepID=UPI0036AD0F74
MASTSVSRVVPASPERVWQLIGGFHALPDWLPYIPESVPLEGGRIRRLRTSAGELIMERMVDFSEQERRYSYSIVEAPFPVSGYLSTLRVHTLPGQEEAAEVQWSARFIPVGVGDDDAAALFTGIFRDGLDALHTAVTGLRV